MVRKIRGPSPARGGGRPAMGGRAGGMDPSAMLSQLQAMQAQVEAAQAQLADESVEASAGGGAVTVVLTGNQLLKSVRINPEVVNADDVELLQDMIVAAVNEAVEKSRKLAEERLGPISGGLPGLM